MNVLKDLSPALALAVSALAVLAFLTLQPPPDARQVAAVFPPWLSFGDRMAAIRDAGGVALDEGGWDGVVLVALPEAAQRGRLLEQGAWLLLDPRGLRGCGAGADAVPTRPDVIRI